jgi:glycosyltransferase involved in cell wall biosynthesis
MKEVIFFSRKPAKNQFSVEKTNTTIIEGFKKYNSHYKLNRIIAKKESRGIINRLFIWFQAYKFKGDIFHVSGDILFSILFNRSKKKVITILDLRYKTYDQFFKKIILKFLWFKLPIKYSDLILTISEEVKKEIIKEFKVPTDKIKVVYVPFDKSKFKNKTIRKSVRDKINVLIIGTKKNKNLSNILIACKNIKTIHLNIIGKIPEELLPLTKDISFKEYIGINDKEVASLYQKSSVLCFPSFFEGFGMPIIEANLSGLPVVCSNIEVLKEIAGNSALFVDPFKADEIKQSIIRIEKNKNLRDELIQKGYENSKKFELKQIIKRYSDAYDALYS